MFAFFRHRRRQKLLAQPLPPAWREVLQRNVSIVQHLPADQRRRLEGIVQVLLAERRFEGCQGLAITDEIRVTIAGQAALMLLGEEGYYFDRVPSVLVYPTRYAREHAVGNAGPVEVDAELLGESWHRGSIILSWPAVLSGGRDPADGRNLVLHEFAHHLDGLDGEMGGTPPLASTQAHDHWRAVFDREYARLCDEVAAGQETLLDPYGTTSQAELFAVATECFFERPAELAVRHPELFACLQGFYKLDPRQWFAAGTRAAPPRMASGDAAAESRKRPGGSTRQLPPEDDEDGTLVPEDLPPLATADQYFTRGSEYLDLGRYELADADLSQAVRLAPQDVEARIELARVRLYLGRWESALETVERALRQAPDDDEARLLRAMCRAALGEYAAALDDFDRLAELPSDDIHAHYYRGLARVECGRIQEALADFSRVIALDPDDAEAWYERARCHDL